jgi:hypothetical protein
MNKRRRYQAKRRRQEDRRIRDAMNAAISMFRLRLPRRGVKLLRAWRILNEVGDI